MGQLTGQVTIVLNGTRRKSKPGAKYDPGGVTRTSVTGDQGTDWAGSLRPAKVEAEFHWTPDLDLAALNAFEGTVQFMADTGQNFVLENAFRSGELVSTAGNSGGVPVVFEADAGTPVG